MAATRGSRLAWAGGGRSELGRGRSSRTTAAGPGARRGGARMRTAVEEAEDCAESTRAATPRTRTEHDSWETGGAGRPGRAKAKSASTSPRALLRTCACSSDACVLGGHVKASAVADTSAASTAAAPAHRITLGGVWRSSPRLTMTRSPPAMEHLDGAASSTGGPAGVVSTAGATDVVWAASVRNETATVSTDTPAKALVAASADAKSNCRALLASSSACCSERAATRAATRTASRRRALGASSRTEVRSTQLVGTASAAAMVAVSCVSTLGDTSAASSPVNVNSSTTHSVTALRSNGAVVVAPARLVAAPLGVADDVGWRAAGDVLG
eukprot:2820912-Rhodomonas_salina.1